MLRFPDILIFTQMATEIATYMYYSGLDSFTEQEVHIARHLRDRKVQRALLQFFKPEHYSDATAGPLQPASEPNASLA